MRKFPRLIAATALALLALSGCRSAPPLQDADPALWVVKDEDTTLYLFGTVHLLKPGLSWFDEAVKDAFDKSDTLVLELVMPPANEMQALVQELGASTNGASLWEQLPPADAEILRRALTTLDLPAATIERFEPWLAATTLASIPLQKSGYLASEGAETVLTAAAQKAGKTITGLESAREQLGFFDQLSPEGQRTLLIETLRSLPDAGANLDKAIAAWSAGEPDQLAAMLNDDMARAPEVADALLTKRNQRWAAWIAKRMEQPGTVFVAVGAGHLAGKGAVQDALAEQGLKVERIEY